MEWTFEGDTPIYTQIMEQIKLQIASGWLKPGDKIPSVRELALEAGVNPNTMQKALSELEREGLLCSQRTAGRFVAKQEGNTSLLQQKLAKDYMKQFTDSMLGLGYKKEDILEIYQAYISNE